MSKKRQTLVKFFQELEMQTQLYHWMTTSYPRHVASDKLFHGIIESADKFMECYLGRYGRSAIKEEHLIIKQMNDKEFSTYLVQVREYLQITLPTMIASTDSDLFNIRDDIVATINQVLYLFSLN